MSRETSKKPTIKIESVSDVSPHNRAVYEAGKNILTESISVGREYCKFMITINTGAIPIYLGILAFLLPEDYVLGIARGAMFTLPTIMYIVGMIVFTLGYLPKASTLSLDIVEDIEEERRKIIERSANYIRFGLVIFIIATILAIGVIVANFGAR